MTKSSTTPSALPDQDGDNRWLDMVGQKWKKKGRKLISIIFLHLQHNRFCSEAREAEPDVLWLGDVLIQDLVNSHIWERNFCQMHSLNFGIGGNRLPTSSILKLKRSSTTNTRTKWSASNAHPNLLSCPNRRPICGQCYEESTTYLLLTLDLKWIRTKNWTWTNRFDVCLWLTAPRVQMLRLWCVSRVFWVTYARGFVWRKNPTPIWLEKSTWKKQNRI